MISGYKTYDTTSSVTRVSSNSEAMSIFILGTFEDTEQDILEVLKDCLISSTSTATIHGYANRECTHKATLFLRVSDPLRLEEVQ